MRVGQDLIVWNLLVRPSGFIGGEDIMAKPPEFLDDPFWEVLVGISPNADIYNNEKREIDEI